MREIQKVLHSKDVSPVTSVKLHKTRIKLYTRDLGLSSGLSDAHPKRWGLPVYKFYTPPQSKIKKKKQI
jgi:hypothetical protein